MPWKKHLVWATGQINAALHQKLEFVLEENHVYRDLLERHSPHCLGRPTPCACGLASGPAIPTAISIANYLRRIVLDLTPFHFLRSSTDSLRMSILTSRGRQSRSFEDAHIKTGTPSIPGMVQWALYDLGGEGVAYHDSDPIDHGSGELNEQPGHQRAHACAYLWNFRQDEGVDVSYVKDGADLSHTNLVSPHINQFYIGYTENNEWCNYTVKVTVPGTYRIRALYAHQANPVRFDLNGKPAADCKLPLATPSYHHWNLAEIGTISFPEAGRQVLTFHYGKGNNFAYFEFLPVTAKQAE